MTKLQELKDFNGKGRPATQRFSLARGDQSGGDGALTQDTLAAWIRESGPPSSRGSEPVEVAATPSRRPHVAERASEDSGYRLRPRPPRHRARALLRAVQLGACLALWSALALWLIGATGAASDLPGPARDVVRAVAGAHGELVGSLQRALAGDD